ncbi:MFS transporter [Leptolyngbya sp. PCC 6406]|uniref:MFS transporter n=1 Tax=Leptolyngbya sp. PCC 6406 TaxID=1173264 RepID=UPI0002E1D8FC|nr:MFS transporter [Leptolyngbya sp. PCC 6406]
MTSQQTKSQLTFWQLWNMSFGFFGIQFGWGLQMANTSAIFEHLGAEAEQIPILWLAAPLTGLVIQPIIGNLSDNTWGPLGRRRPYFLVGAILGSLALVWMPNAGRLWVAVGLLWLLDTAANVTMEPFRAFVSDLLPSSQRTQGFAWQSLFIGLGAVLASASPWLLTHSLGVSASAQGTDAIPPSVRWSFYVGAVVFLGSVLWTVLFTEERPPRDMVAFRAQQERRLGVMSTLREIAIAFREMPTTMRQLAWVQGFSWLGMYCVFLYFPPAIAHNLFGAMDEASALYGEGVEWAGLCMATYNAVCFGVSFGLPSLAAATNRQVAHALCLTCGGLGLIALMFVPSPLWVLLPMVGLGVAWAAMLSLPYAMVVGALPERKGGIYMGIFNLFIVLPEIVASLGLGWVITHLLEGNRLLVLGLGGICFLIAALFTLRVREMPATKGTAVLEKGEPGSKAMAVDTLPS